MKPVLFLDFRNDGATIGDVGGRRVRWSSAPRGKEFRLLAAAISRMKGCAAIAVARSARGSGRDASWSVIRAAVATGNALAFAKHVPVVDLALSGNETKDDLAARIRGAAKRAKKRRWIKAAYDGEPNITKAKPAL